MSNATKQFNTKKKEKNLLKIIDTDSFDFFKFTYK